MAEAFKSTLEEAANADIIINLIDISADDGYEQAQVTAELLKESTSDPEVNVAFVAGEGFFVGQTGQGRNCMRMSFGNNSPERIREGVMKLGKLIEKKLAQQSK